MYQAAGISNRSPHPQFVDGAGFWLRFIAFIIDAFIAPVFSFVLACISIIPLYCLTRVLSDPPDWVKTLGVIYVVVWGLAFSFSGLLYFAWFESSNLQATPGKLALGLIVTGLYGERLSFWRALGRNSAKLFSYLTFYLGFLLAAFTERKQALHDMMALTLVLRKPKYR